MKVLVISLARFGDIIESTSMLKGLKLKHPECRITYLLQTDFRYAAPVIPYIEQIIEFDFRKIYEILFYKSYKIQDAYQYLDSFFKDIITERFEKIINITPNNVGILSAFLSGDNSILNGRKSDWTNYFLTVTTNWHTLPLHFCDMYSKMAGLDTNGIVPEVKISDKAHKWADSFLKSCNIRNEVPIIGFNPGASHEVKQWRKEYFIETGKMILNRYRVNLILYGSDSERELCEEVRTGIGHEGVVNAAGKTDIEQFAALLRKTDILITNDTGSMHLASACGTKIISFHTGKEKCFSTGPYGDGHIAIQAGISCHPCNNPDICRTKQCRDIIKPELVFEVFEKMINNDNDFSSLKNHLNVYKSRIDEKAMVDYVPAGRQYLNVKTFNRYILRLMLNHCLTGANDSLPYNTLLRNIGQSLYYIDYSCLQQHFKILSSQFEPLLSLCERGIATTADLKRAGGDTSNNIETLKELSAEIEEIDCLIIGKAESIDGFETLAHLFRSEKNGLNGSDILLLAHQTEDIYLKLKYRIETITKLCEEFFILNNTQTKEVYHEHFSKRNANIFAA